jgi:S-formylglutathione hydrolase FrmB
MALIRLDHLPQSTQVIQPLMVLLPDPGRMNGIPVRKRKLLYLLHGLSDDATAWQRYSAIETVAQEYGLVVVMPSVGRSFYADLPNGQKYFTYLVEELPQYLSDVFDLVPSREDTLIAGLSMGGYGAFKAAFLHPERFAAAASFSGFLSMEFIKAHPDDPRFAEFSTTMGDLQALENSIHDPMTWIKRLAESTTKPPNLYMSCGTDDDLLPLNRLFIAQCQAAGIQPAYREEEGAKHDWFFWDREIRVFLKQVLG